MKLPLLEVTVREHGQDTCRPSTNKQETLKYPFVKWSKLLSDGSSCGSETPGSKSKSVIDATEKPLIDGEPTKQPVRGPGRLLRLGLVIHIPPVLASCGLLWLNATPRYWFDSAYSVSLKMPNQVWKLVTADILHMLQLAAKVYEIIIIISISTIVLDIYLSNLVGSGLPLGLITGGYRVGNLGYLTHSGLWSSLRTKSRSLAGFTIICSLCSIAIGPSSAILLIPSPAWWTLQHPTDEQFMMLYGPLTNWTTHFQYEPNGHADPMMGCEGGNHYELPYTFCPGYGFGQILDSISRVNRTSLQTNLVIASSTTSNSRWLKASRIQKGSNQTTVSTTLADITIEAIDRAAKYSGATVQRGSPLTNLRISNAQTDRVYQPLVQAKCSIYSWNSIRAALNSSDIDQLPRWPTDGLECFDDNVCVSWKSLEMRDQVINASYWDFDPENGKVVDFKWVDLPSAPLSAIFRVPVNFTLSNQRTNNSTEDRELPQDWKIGACSFISRWVYSGAQSQIGQSDIIESDITEPGALAINETILHSGSAGLPLVVRPSWANFVNFALGNDTKSSPYTDHNHTVGLNALDTFLVQLLSLMSSETKQYVSAMEDDYTAGAVESMVSQLLADGISRSTIGSTKDRLYISAHVDDEKLIAVKRSDEAYTANSVNRFSAIMPSSELESGVRSDRLDLLLTTFNFDNQGAAYVKIVVTMENRTCPAILIQESVGGQARTSCTMWAFPEFVKGLGADYSTAWNFFYEQYGYGSGRSSSTVTFGIVMVCLYLSVVLLCSIQTLVSGFVSPAVGKSFPISSTRSLGIASWGDVQDLLALCLVSKPPEIFHNIGGGIKAFSSFWRENMMIRVTEDNHLELQTSHMHTNKRIEQNGFYS